MFSKVMCDTFPPFFYLYPAQSSHPNPVSAVSCTLSVLCINKLLLLLVNPK